MLFDISIFYCSSTLKVAAATSSSTASKPSDNKRPLRVGGLASFTSNLSAKKQKVWYQTVY